MRVTLAMVALVAMLAFAGSSEAVTLTNTNTTEFAGIVITVNIGSVTNGNAGCNVVAGCTTLSVQLTTSPPLITNTAVGIDQFLFNATTATVNAIAASPGTWNLGFDGTNADGFGDFNSNRNQDSVGTSGISSPIVFTLGGLTTFTPNGNSANFVAHVTFSGGCEGWVSDGTASASSNSNCTPVPEPITIFLGGTGLLGMAWAGRKRLFGRFAT
jgi:hypothetical protein